MEMNYESMWNDMKSTYEVRLEKLKLEGKKGTPAWIGAKRFVDVMTKFELVQEDKIKDSDGMDDYHFNRLKANNQ